MFFSLLLVMLGFCGLAIDAGLIYNRKAELHGIAEGIALAAARQLDGTATGIDSALTKAGEAAGRLKYRYHGNVAWRNDAIEFSNSPAAGSEWVSADTARSAPGNRYYVKVDTRALDADIGTVTAYFLQLLPGTVPDIHIGEHAIAGRSTIHVMPLAICAMSPDIATARTNPGPPVTVELVQYGFRRGVTYDLMRLNPGGTTPANFAIDPLAPPGGLGSAANTTAGAIGQFVCTGRLWTPRITGGMIRVGSPFPIGALYRHFNARFDDYESSACKVNGAPPDFNIKAYSPGPTGGASWMSPRPSHQRALESASGGRLHTIADLAAPPAGTTGGMYGPLWAYARAVRYSSYVPGAPEPRNGYARFAPADWPSLYPSSPLPTPSGYPSSTQPYQPITGTYYDDPRQEHLPLAVIDRRILHIPLLACPVDPGANVGATAVGVARFFMTAPADETGLYAEFAGLIPENQLAGEVTLYP